MKKVILAICILAISSTLAFAEEGKALVKKDFILKTEGAESLSGSVRSMILADISRPNSEMIVSGDGGRDVQFVVGPATVIFDGASGNILSLREIAAGDNVLVSYVKNNEGVLRTMGIKLVPKDLSAAMLENPAQPEKAEPQAGNERSATEEMPLPEEVPAAMIEPAPVQADKAVAQDDQAGKELIK